MIKKVVGMSAFTPSASWEWQCREDVLVLDTGIGCHRTGFKLSHLLSLPVNQAFTLEQAEAYWLYWHRLESLGWPLEHCFAAALDAVAGQFYLRQTGHKSWWFQPLSRQFQPVAASLVVLKAEQNFLGLVLCQTGECARILLLQHGLNLQSKALSAGQVVTVLCDRLLPYQHQTPLKFAKSA
jgi:hypothetical protein